MTTGENGFAVTENGRKGERMKIDISNKNAYDAVCDVIREMTRNADGYEVMTERIVRIRTTVLGESNELLLCDEFDYYWETDWYEGGEVELLGFIDLDDVDVPFIGEGKM